jgi:NADH-quinone oxidoreductase subunit G
MTQELVTIEINDQSYEVPKGAMLIDVADANNIKIPRFCYHKKLSVAANCRMCLVEMEKSFKPVPACATPVGAGMKFWTKSEKARNAQKAIMEFLLINHPLDCPICDQGGECELQDISVAYGQNHSHYHEIKRVVPDKSIGPLVETEMTRCIQCTRCVRFGAEIAGMREMGGIFRGDRLEIGTFIKKSLKSELSANIIDLCPVGALTAKPSRYKARAWEMKAHDSIAPHDSVGSNIELHTFRKEVVRCVPRENDSINECWLSDRDRFSYQGIYSKDRLSKPMVRRDGQLVAVTWEEALIAAAEILRSADTSKVAALANPTSTLEELYLFQRLMRGLNIRNIEHRLRQLDFSDQTLAPVSPTLGVKIAELEQQNAVLLIGSNVRQEQPLFNHRLRKAALKGAKITALNPRGFDFNYPAEQIVVAPSALVAALAGLAKASLEVNQAAVPAELVEVLNGVDSSDADRATVAGLKEVANKLVLLGNLAVQHPAFGTLRALASVIAAQTGAKLGYLPESANSVGAWLAGVVPHRLSAGRELKQTGATLTAMLQNTSTFVLLNTETADFANPAQAAQSLANANNVIVIGAFADQAVLDNATVILPGSTFAETAGTYCNAEGNWQTFQGATEPVGDARPTWKVLRVLGNTAGVHEFDWVHADEVAAELKAELFEENGRDNSYTLSPVNPVALPQASNGQFERVAYVRLYREDGLVRRAEALQKMVEPAVVELNPSDAASLGVQDGDMLQVSQADVSVNLAVQLSTEIAVGTVGLASGYAATAALNAFGLVQLSKVG